eukprot:GHVN01105262.1.p1 GENE.GHVN01105262.1~~GHVN01105262.1.p1  ORF type:complete len:286 (+),score=7.77 GHVN01105262.1:76-858(+)
MKDTELQIVRTSLPLGLDPTQPALASGLTLVGGASERVRVNIVTGINADSKCYLVLLCGRLTVGDNFTVGTALSIFLTALANFCSFETREEIVSQLARDAYDVVHHEVDLKPMDDLIGGRPTHPDEKASEETKRGVKELTTAYDMAMKTLCARLCACTLIHREDHGPDLLVGQARVSPSLERVTVAMMMIILGDAKNPAETALHLKHLTARRTAYLDGYLSLTSVMRPRVKCSRALREGYQSLVWSGPQLAGVRLEQGPD